MGSQTVFTETKVDQTTGELIPTRWIKRSVQNAEMFIRTYVEDMGKLAKCSGAEQSVILCCLKYLDYNTNIMYLDSLRRDEICVCGALKKSTVNTSISRLVKKNILIKESNSKYILNPKLFFFGSDIERDKVFQLTISYQIVE